MKLAMWGGIMGRMNETHLQRIKQLGANHVVFNGLPPEPEGEPPHLLDLLNLTELCGELGLEVLSIENLHPQQTYYDEIMVGGPDRDRRIEVIQQTIANLGQVGIPYFGYHWMMPPKPQGGPHAVVRTARRGKAIRGGARVSHFDNSQVQNLPLYRGRVIHPEEMWENYAYFIRAVMPVAESAGVMLSLHPDDPPLPQGFGGIPRIFSRLEDFLRGEEIAASPNWGLTLCLGNWALIGLDALDQAIRHFGPQGKICYVHVQAVQGTPEKFTEQPFEEGKCDFLHVFRLLDQTGFDGCLIGAHTPGLIGDDLSGINGAISEANGVGYLTAMIQVVHQLRQTQSA